MAKLEKILNRAISLRDVESKDIYNSGKYQFGSNGVIRKVKIYLATTATPGPKTFPWIREVHFYEGDVWQVIWEATQHKPLAVWLLGSQDRLLSVDQFVLQDGSAYRTLEAHERLLDVCDDLGDSTIAKRAFGENHAASIMAKETAES